MKKTDLGVVGFMYAVCGLFYYMSFDLKAAAQTYPRFIIALLFGLTTLYLITLLFTAKKEGVTSGLAEVFDGFMPIQFFGVLAMIIAYMVVMYLAGFYIATVLFMIGCLAFLKVPKLHIILATVFILALIYFAFTSFLGVKLPAGIFFS